MKHRIRVYQYTMPQLSRREQDFLRVQEILDGEEGLWEELYESAYETVVYCAARADYGRLLRADEYRDVADEAFARCFEQLERYHGLSRFAYWVGGYAKNITRCRCARELTRIRNRDLLRGAAAAETGKYDPLQVMLHLERDRCLWKAFFDLPRTDRRIVWGRVFDNIAPRTIARSLALTRREVLNRYEEALFLLRLNFLRYYRSYDGSVS